MDNYKLNCNCSASSKIAQKVNMKNTFKILIISLLIGFCNVSYSQIYDYYISQTVKNLENENAKRALVYANKAIEQDSTHYLAVCFKGSAYYELKNMDSALIYLEKAENLNDTALITLKMLARVHNSLSNYEKSLAYYNKYLKYDPTNLLILSNKALIQCNLKMYDKALRTINYGLELNPHDVDIINVYGLYYERQRMYEKAKKQFSRVLEIDPMHANATYNRCRMNNFLNYEDENCSDCRKAIELGIEDGALFILNSKKCKY